MKWCEVSIKMLFCRFANKKSFIFVFGIVGLIFASSHAYYNGTITTMEKRFKIPSKNMGFIGDFCIEYLRHVEINYFRHTIFLATGNDITGFLLSMFIAYYGGRGKKRIQNLYRTFSFKF